MIEQSQSPTRIGRRLETGEGERAILQEDETQSIATMTSEALITV
jgi:hypothetical protein